MVQVTITYEGDLRCEAMHGPSQTRITTDAPKDNQGKGESFSPTDLVATALGSCMLTVMGIAGRAMNVDLRGAKITVEKEMVASPTRRIGKLTVNISVPGTLSDEQKHKLEKAALSCPVHKSLHPDIQMPISWNWE